MISTENKEVKNFHTHDNRHKPKSFPTSYKLRLKTGLKSTILLCYDDKAERGHLSCRIRLSVTGPVRQSRRKYRLATAETYPSDVPWEGRGGAFVKIHFSGQYCNALHNVVRKEAGRRAR